MIGLAAVTLNIGSGRDTWGDIRLDLRQSQTGISNRPNVVASATCLPVRNHVMTEIRCWHVIEHITDWNVLLNEVARVSHENCRLELRFPIDDGFKRDFLLSCTRGDITGMRHAYITRKTRAHSWIVDPEGLSRRLSSLGFAVSFRRNKRWLFFPFWAFLPRWRRLLPGWFRNQKNSRKIERLHVYFPKLDYEWVVTGTKQSGRISLQS